MQTYIFVFILLFFSSSYAQTCPSIDDLHHQNLHGWRAFDIDNGTLLSTERLLTYTQQAQEFALAEWMDEAPEGPAHCYYYDTQKDSSYLGAFLASQDVIPDNWKGPQRNVMQCYSGINECRFMEK